MTKNIDREKILLDVCNYLNCDLPRLNSDILEDNIREICVAKLCQTMGLNCEYNFKNGFFDNYSIITGEVVCERLNIRMHVANDNLRLIRYQKINFVQYVRDLFDVEDVDEAIIDAFNFSRRYNQIISSIV